jgi:putative membrane protein
MKNFSEGVQVHRLSPVGLVILFLMALQKFLKNFWPVIVVFAVKDKITVTWLYVALGVLLLVGLHAILSYLHFKFYYSATEFVLQKGYLRKSRIVIPLEKIQAVNTKQNLVQQLFGVVAVDIETAGSDTTEITLLAVSQSFAATLQSELLKESVHQPLTSNGSNKAEPKPIVKLSPSNLFQIGLSMNPLRGILLLAAFGYSVIDQMRTAFESQVKESLHTAEMQLQVASATAMTVVVIVVLILSLAISLIITLVQFYGLSLSRSCEGYRLVSGLITRKGITIRKEKVQIILLSTNPLKKWLGFKSLWFLQVSTKGFDAKQRIEIPGVTTYQENSILNEMFPRLHHESFRVIKPARRYLSRLIMRIAVIPGLLLAGAGFFSNWLWIAAAVLFPVLIVLSILDYRKKCLQISSEYLIFSSGVIGLQQYCTSITKIQSVMFKQSFWQKRAGLASLVFVFAAERYTMPFILEHEAREIMDFCLYTVESSSDKWM